MSGKFRIGAAVIFGVALVTSAFLIRSLGDRVKPAEVEIASLEYQNSPEGAGDNTLFSDNFNTSTSTRAYQAPTTVSGKVIGSMLISYLGAKSSDVNPTEARKAIVGDASNLLDRQAIVLEPYTYKQIITTESTPTSLREYGNEIAAIITNNIVSTESETTILQRVMDTESPEELTKLAAIADAYGVMLEETHKVAVPTILASHHIELLNGYQALRRDVEAMQQILSDPVYAAVNIKTYPEDVAQLQAALRGIIQTLHKNGVYYNEPSAGHHLEQFAL